jgi:DNA polymerase I-like protein with 3'-5' exonuclease and polymerase domains
MTKVTVGGVCFDVERWRPGMQVLVDSHIAVDTETEMIVEGEPPKLVLIQACSYRLRKVQYVWWEDKEAYLNEMFQQNPQAVWIFHNAPFDMRVLGGCRETKQWRDAVISGRVIDTGLRFILHRLYHGDMAEQWSLDYAAKTMLNVVLPKDKDIRLTFMQDMDLSHKHVIYAVKDAIITAQLREVMPKAYNTEAIHVKGYIALSEIGNLGMLVDSKEMESVRQEFLKEAEGYYGILALFGWRPKLGWESGDVDDDENADKPAWSETGTSRGKGASDAIVQRILADIEEHIEVKLPRTKKSKKYQLNQETVDILWEATGKDHPFIENYNEAKHCEKIISTYLKDALVHQDGRVHPFFSPLMKTGRTSCSRPNIQNIPRKGGVRGIYEAPQGHVLFACDYSQAELCSLAETCYLRQGKSVMRDVINSGEDLHRWFGRMIMEENGGSAEDGINYRQMAKPCNFGFPGGLGAANFQKFAKDSYGVKFSREQCVQLKGLWLEAFPEMIHHLKPEEDSLHTIRRVVVQDDGTEVLEVDNRYIAQTINGRIRRNATYCSACNYSFQGLVADGAKMALWYLYLRGYRVVNFIHDEVIVELPIDDQLQTRVADISDLMIRGMKQVIHHVSIKTEGALMRRWYKEAEPVFDNEGNLLIWEPTL